MLPLPTPVATGSRVRVFLCVETYRNPWPGRTVPGRSDQDEPILTKAKFLPQRIFIFAEKNSANPLMIYITEHWLQKKVRAVIQYSRTNCSRTIRPGRTDFDQVGKVSGRLISKMNRTCWFLSGCHAFLRSRRLIRVDNFWFLPWLVICSRSSQLAAFEKRADRIAGATAPPRR